MAKRILIDKKTKKEIEKVKDDVKTGVSKLGSEFTLNDDGVKWSGKEIETKSDRLENDGSGEQVILRKFDFNLPPKSKDIPEVLPQQLIEFHKPKITAFLWKDNLDLIQELKIHVDSGKFTIFATCRARSGSTILEKPKLIQHIANPNV